MNAKQLIAFAAVLTVSVSSFAQPLRLDLLGNSGPVSAANRTIVITPGTEYVNVTGGETINFVVGGKSFAWTFDGPSIAFNLDRAAPANTLDHKVMVYVAINPLYDE